MLYFNSKSKDAKPGQGVHEEESETTSFEELSQIKDWRKILSNFAITPFKFYELTWNTVEHAFQAQKFKDLDYNSYFDFSLDSGSELSKKDGSAARLMRKKRILNSKQLAAWDKVKDEIMKDLWKAKFEQNEEARNVLLLTKDAELWHGMPRSSVIVRLHDLEMVRTTLRDLQTV